MAWSNSRKPPVPCTIYHLLKSTRNAGLGWASQREQGSCGSMEQRFINSYSHCLLVRHWSQPHRSRGCKRLMDGESPSVNLRAHLIELSCWCLLSSWNFLLQHSTQSSIEGQISADIGSHACKMYVLTVIREDRNSVERNSAHIIESVPFFFFLFTFPFLNFLKFGFFYFEG